ncbi:MAG: PEGA domain-containing protein [Candidatus Aminicenantes bacterium]|nr:PEGA domain-containing protein [Candidatus Aminicenantes bacterium]
MKIMAVNKIYKSKLLAYSLILSFLFLITTEAKPSTASSDLNEGFKPVVRVQEEDVRINDAQKDRFDKLFEEGKKLYQEQMDYEGAIEKFSEALNLTTTRTQKADVFYHMSLAHYGDLSNKGTKDLFETIRRLIEVDYYRELDEILCPPKYIELFEGIKKEYGALRIQSKPAGADVYLSDSETPVGKTPLIIGAKAGSLAIKIQKGKKAKNDILKVVAEKETTSPVYVLKGVSTLPYIIGGIALAVGAGAALLSGGGAGEDGQAPGPTTGSIQVNSTPQGASIYLDGSATGQTTNSTLTNVSPGSHTVTLVKEGYEDYGENISVTAGQTTTVNATLSAVVITVTNPISSTIWTKGVDVQITWGSSGSPSFQGNVRKSNGFNHLSNSGRNLLPSFRRRALRSVRSFKNLIRTRRELDKGSNVGSFSSKEITSSESTKINSNRPSGTQDVSRRFPSSRRGVKIPRKITKNSGIIKNNNAFGKVNPPVFRGISSQIFKSSENTRALALTDVKIDLYKGGVFQELIEPNTENDGTHTWNVSISLVDDSDYKVRISSASEPGIYDESDEFTIETKFINVTKPTSTTVWTKGNSETITWDYTGTISNVKIELWRGGGSPEEIIALSTANNGSYTWEVPISLQSAQNYYVKVICVGVPEIFDESDGFQITN